MTKQKEYRILKQKDLMSSKEFKEKLFKQPFIKNNTKLNENAIKILVDAHFSEAGYHTDYGITICAESSTHDRLFSVGRNGWVEPKSDSGMTLRGYSVLVYENKGLELYQLRPGYAYNWLHNNGKISFNEKRIKYLLKHSGGLFEQIYKKNAKDIAALSKLVADIYPGKNLDFGYSSMIHGDKFFGKELLLKQDIISDEFVKIKVYNEKDNLFNPIISLEENIRERRLVDPKYKHPVVQKMYDVKRELDELT